MSDTYKPHTTDEAMTMVTTSSLLHLCRWWDHPQKKSPQPSSSDQLLHQFAKRAFGLLVFWLAHKRTVPPRDMLASGGSLKQIQR
jgi:hypothetical protein